MTWTAAGLAEAIGARVEGDGTLEISGVAAPERAGSKELIYVEAAKFAERAAGSKASCVVAEEGIALPGKTILRSGRRCCWNARRLRSGFTRRRLWRRWLGLARV